MECPFLYHWNGTDWRSYFDPAAGGKQRVSAVSAYGQNNVWVVGTSTSTDTYDGGNLDHGMVWHWNGSLWGQVPAGFGTLNDIDATADGVWAVGHQTLGSGLGSEMLIEKFDGAFNMSHQTVQRIAMAPVPNKGTTYTGDLLGVSVGDGVVTSVGDYQPTSNVLATLTERRDAN
jgi:hypothetical protein